MNIVKQIQDSIAVKEELLKTAVPLIEKMAFKISDCLKRGGKILFMGNGQMPIKINEREQNCA